MMSLTLRNIMILLYLTSLPLQVIASGKDVEINFNASCDFSELAMTLREEHNVNPDIIILNIKLQPAASAHFLQLSRDHTGQKMTLYINGVKISTTTIRSELNSRTLRVAVEKKQAKILFPNLLDTQCHQR